MPANKSQHFVPRCHFKPFSLAGEGNAVNLYNLKSRTGIANASISGQCAKDYIYGKSLDLEDRFRQVEGGYAQIVRSLASERRLLSNWELSFLRGFALLQAMRTEAALQRIAETTEKMRTAVFRGRMPEEPPENYLPLTSISMFVGTLPYIQDLATTILVSKCELDFITSDDPAISANRFHTQRLGEHGFGWINSGAQLFMPLTPRHALLCYDSGVYKLEGADEPFVEVRKSADISAINDLQLLYCARNVYFKDWKTRDLIHERYQAIEKSRLASRHNLTVYVKEPDEGQGESYRIATEDEKNGQGPFLLTTQFKYPSPPRWFSMLRYRLSPRMYHNGSAVGFVRNLDWIRRKDPNVPRMMLRQKPN